MPDEELDERHGECMTRLVRISADDVSNPYKYPAVTCPSCLEIVRVER